MGWSLRRFEKAQEPLTHESGRGSITIRSDTYSIVLLSHYFVVSERQHGSSTMIIAHLLQQIYIKLEALSEASQA